MEPTQILLLIGLFPVSSIVAMMMVGIVGNAFNVLERADDYITDPKRYLPYVVVGVGRTPCLQCRNFLSQLQNFGISLYFGIHRNH